jgi:hypothetical protein
MKKRRVIDPALLLCGCAARLAFLNTGLTFYAGRRMGWI